MEIHPKNQHYVPRFLLKNFCSKDENHIWCYDKTYKKAEERSISKVASESYFYDKVAGQKEGSLEYLLSKAETESAPVVSKIIQTKSLDLTLEEKTVLTLFISLQLTRTKSAYKNYEAFSEDLIGKIKAIYDSFNVELDLEEKTHKETWLDNFNSTPDLANVLMNKLWFLLKSDRKFYISDNPVVRQNTINRNDVRGTLGLNSDGIEIYFPLNDSLIICLLCERTFAKAKGIEIPISDPIIENINSLQVIYSDRFVFSSTNNFELVKDMIDKSQA